MKIHLLHRIYTYTQWVISPHIMLKVLPFDSKSDFQQLNKLNLEIPILFQNSLVFSLLLLSSLRKGNISTSALNLTDDEIRFLMDALPGEDHKKKWELLFVSDKHGKSYNRFCYHVTGRGPSLGIFSRLEPRLII